MATRSAGDVARLLTELSQRTALAGGNPYRARAYSRASEAIAVLAEPLEKVIASNRLRDLPGIGETIADIIEKMHSTGSHPTLERLRSEVPDSVLEMLAIPGLRPEKVAKLHNDLGISTVKQLEEAAREHRLSKVKGLGPAIERRILEGLEIREETPGARHLLRAAELLATAVKSLEASGLGLTRIVPAGEFRRGSELVSELSVVAQAPKLEGGTETLRDSELTVHLSDKAHYGAVLLLATGAGAHVEQLRRLAAEKEMELRGDGLYRGRRLIAARSETDIYRALGLPFVPPELREGRGEVAKAACGELPDLVAADDIKGILHAHTVASDGANTLEEMAEASRQRGYAYFGVADHSRSAHYAGGLSIAEIETQHREIDRLNAGYRRAFRVFKGIEFDILADGSLDYPDEVLARFDFVVASIHGQFRLNRQAQTDRLLRAIANPFTTILGHMTGRQLLRRKGYDVDIDRVLSACAEHGVAVEINGNPWRLDLDWRWHGRGIELGCMFSINPDAHSTSEIDLVRWGVLQARKGGVGKAQVLNCLTRQAFERFLSKRRTTSRVAER